MKNPTFCNKNMNREGEFIKRHTEKSASEEFLYSFSEIFSAELFAFIAEESFMFSFSSRNVFFALFDLFWQQQSRVYALSGHKKSFRLAKYIKPTLTAVFTVPKEDPLVPAEIRSAAARRCQSDFILPRRSNGA